MKKTVRFLLLLLTAAASSCGDSSGPDGADSPVASPAIPAGQVVIYEILVRNFSQTGDFNGVTQRLDTLKALGINTIWLMPVHPVGQIRKNGTYGSPYSVKNYTDVNPEFGTLKEFRTLITESHRRGMAVILDWVANHTAWDHDWISRHKDWYTQDGSGNIVIPPGTNWQDVADLNYSNASLRHEMIKSMAWWITETGVDGFRCDAADMVPDDFWKQALDSLKTLKSNLILLAEGSKSTHFASGFRMNYGWDFYSALKAVFKSGQSATGLNLSDQTEVYYRPSGNFKLRFTTNHDESSWDATPVSLFGGPAGAMAATAVSLSLGEIPLIYNGQETGISSTQNIFEKSTIDWTKNREMQTFYRQILNLVREHEAFRSGTKTSYSTTHVFRVRRETPAETLFIAVNTRNTPQALAFPAELRTRTWKNLLTGSPFSAFDETLSPYGSLILKSE